MKQQDGLNEQEELRKKRRQAAIDSLTFFVSKYSPATTEDADTFYTTTDIQKAVADHTGFTLEAAEIYELMIQMNYKYEPMNGLEFNWLLKK